MHILHLIKTSEGATWAIRLIESMSQVGGFTFSVVIPAGGKHHNQYKRVCKNVYELDYKLDITFISNGKQLIEIVKDLKPDIIHSWFTQTTLYSRIFLRKFKIPKLFQVVGPAHLENKLFKYGDVLSAGKDDYWIASSDYIRNMYLYSGVDKSRVFLNYPFIDPAKLLDEARSIEPYNFREEFSIPDKAKIIGTASYIYSPKFYQSEGIKNHEFLLKCFEKIIEHRDDVYLIISGKPFGADLSYLKKLKDRAAKISNEKIIFTGGYDHIAKVIPNFDVFVYLSKSENMGGVFESLLFEVPTVSSDRGALPELVKDGVTGYTVKLNSVTDAATNIINLIESLDPSMTHAGKEKVLNIFNPEKITQKTFEIYDHVMDLDSSQAG